MEVIKVLLITLDDRYEVFKEKKTLEPNPKRIYNRYLKLRLGNMIIYTIRNLHYHENG